MNPLLFIKTTWNIIYYKKTLYAIDITFMLCLLHHNYCARYNFHILFISHFFSFLKFRLNCHRFFCAVFIDSNTFHKDNKTLFVTSITTFDKSLILTDLKWDISKLVFISVDMNGNQKHHS